VREAGFSGFYSIFVPAHCSSPFAFRMLDELLWTSVDLHQAVGAIRRGGAVPSFQISPLDCRELL
jgi:hypothetical protein